MPTFVNPSMKEIVKSLPPVIVLLWLWGGLINHLRIAWSLNEQYNYGWGVPFLCAYLLWRRWQSAPRVSGEASTRSVSLIGGLWFATLALLYAPIRLIEDANPEWRLVSCALAGITVGITLLLIQSTFGVLTRRHLTFPVLYFLVAVPWPTIIEHPVIQGLTQFNASLSVEFLNLIGVPALQRGNLIEISTGVLGIDEACSGIRSFQATLMLALFFGELYRMKPWRRLALCAAGFGLSLLFNLLRTNLLVFVASKQGIDAVSRWHNPAGVTIFVACFTGLWLIARVWRSQPNQSKAIDPSSRRALAPRLQSAGKISLRLAVWLAVVEASVEAWYAFHERKLPPPLTWQAVFPTDHSSYHEIPIAARTRMILRNDAGLNAVWRGVEDSQWQGTFLQWEPGRTATHLARNHTPEVCLAAAGGLVLASSELRNVTAQGIQFPVRFYEVAQGERTLHVLYCLWSDQSGARQFQTQSLTVRSRLEAAFAGVRLVGQRSLELVVLGFAQREDAERALTQQFSAMIRLPPNSNPDPDGKP